MGFCPFDIGCEVILEPFIPGLSGGVVHVAHQIRDDKRDVRKFCEIFGPVHESAVHGWQELVFCEIGVVCLPVGPRVVFAGVELMIVPVEAGFREVLAIASEGEMVSQKLGSKIGCGERKMMGSSITFDALGIAGENGDVIRLARVGNAVGVSEEGGRFDQLVDERSVFATDDLLVATILIDHDDDVVVIGNSCCCRCGMGFEWGGISQRAEQNAGGGDQKSNGDSSVGFHADFSK